MEATWDYTGHQLLLGHTAEHYGIWSRENPDAPQEVLPLTSDGWQQAWARFIVMEPNAAPVANQVWSEPMTATLQGYGEFKKFRISPLTRYGQWRHQGSVSVTPEGLVVEGKHVFPLLVRVAILLAVIAVSISFGEAGMIISFNLLGLVIAYLGVEYVILQREEMRVPWTSVRRCIFDPARTAVVFDTTGPRHKRPVVFVTPEAANLYTLARFHIPDRCVESGVKLGAFTKPL